MKEKIKYSIELLRLPFLSLSILSVAIAGGAVKYFNGKLDFKIFILILLTVSLAHLANNVFNDYYDHLSGNDPANKNALRPFSGGSGVLTEGKLTPSFAKRLAFFLLFLSIISGGAVIFITKNIYLLLAGAFGVFFVLSYSGFLKLGYKNMGEILIFLVWGPLIVCGTFYAITGNLIFKVVILSFISGFLASTVLLINEFADKEADEYAGKKTFVNTFGGKAGIFLISAIILFSYILYIYLFLKEFNYVKILPLLSSLILIPSILEAYKKYNFKNSLEFLPVVKKFIGGINIYLTLIVIVLFI